jgi:DNA mismatch endonuclease, patch repair protein
MLVRRYLHRRGFRYRLAKKGLPGKPDLVLLRYGAVVLVHGCYWHGHPGCRFATTSATRPEFWKTKIGSNRERDARVFHQLRQLGWRVAVVWECALRSNAEKSLEELEAFLRSDQSEIEITSLA